MKINKYIIATFMGAVALTSCDDFLNVESPSQFDPNYVFSNENDALKMLLGAYKEFNEDPFSSRMANVWAQNTDVECIAPGDKPDGSRRDIWSLQGGLLENWSDIQKAWDSNYLAVDRCNQVIEGLAGKTEPGMRALLGEAHCLRAYRYWMLCCNWGDVPYFAQAAKAGMELDLPKTDKNIIFTKEIQALVDHEEDMPFSDVAPAGVERMNRDFALGLIARLAMYRAGYGMTADGTMKRADDYLDVTSEDLTVTYTIDGTEKKASTSRDYYQLAKDYCQKLIRLKGRELHADYKDIFKKQCEFVTTPNDEILYEIAHVEGNGGDVAWCIGQVVTGSSKGTTTIQVNLSPAYYCSFDDKDIRRDVTCTFVKHTADNIQALDAITGIAVGKWSRMMMTSEPGSASSKGTGINWTLMRYAEVLLTLAEAENELNGPTDLAKDQLKKVRARAFAAEDKAEKVDAYVNALTTPDDFRNAVINERAWEFGGEALRKYDLVRWNVYGKKIVETKEMLTQMGRSSVDEFGTEPGVQPYLTYARKLYYTKNKGMVSFLNTKYALPEEEVPADSEIVKAEDLDKAGNEGKYATHNFTSTLIKAITVKDPVTGEEVKTGEYEPANYIVNCYRGYTDATGESAVPYLLPIPAQKIANSTVLNNNGYGIVRGAN
ncbi:RagB/SusD family nutrient uptake outer membrane protein [uncultured Bacteroides sp.]|uniref:RagB/SusD family nutrient uptake outer membrane protein n=1 Tax=uncultured Bacteroides sp. TaxID=162156 RepID=UPI0025CE0280|nr:RagB/SusD family nutrient uptake outer membrane protein [uncultured Bacteroides sp.]